MTSSRCECSSPGYCNRHRCQKTAHWHKLCQTRPDYFALWEQGRGPGQLPASHSENSTWQSPPPNLTVGVVVISHNYGRFLSECLESVLAQSYSPKQVLVIDDASTDDTWKIAESYADLGIGYRRIEAQNVHTARHAGFESVQTEILCFVDADDLLAPEYLERGLAEFIRPETAVVYSDVEWFGARTEQVRYPAVFDRSQLQRENYLHAGSLVRREALLASRAFEVDLDPRQHIGDWFLWRRVLTGKWTARKQGGIYRYRRHADSLSAKRRANGGEINSYYRRAALDLETLTLFIPLAGRRDYWPRLAQFLEHQSWPRTQIRILLCDTSQDWTFAQMVRSWIAQSDYPDVRYFSMSVGRAGLADESRPGVVFDVRKAMFQIYARLIQEANTNFVWILEDDLLPPDDVCERLLRGFDAQTVSVSAPYLSRFHGKFVAWDHQGRHYEWLGNGCQSIGGNGFGCVILRRFALEQLPYEPERDFDRLFYQEVQKRQWKAKLDWSAPCEHGRISQSF